MKNFNQFNYLLFTIVFLLFFSCGKDNQNQLTYGEGNARVQISISTKNIEDVSNGKTASRNLDGTDSDISLDDIKQIQTIDVGDGYDLQATLINETLLDKKTKVAATGIDRNQQLAPDVKYRLIVYNTNGDYVTHKDYQYGKESQAGDLMLIGGTGGTEYTFVVYSINSTSALPNIVGLESTNIQNTNLMVDAVQSDLMFFKKNLRVSKGNNKLNVELAHLFSQITTTIALTNATEGFIKKIENPNLKPSASTATINFGTSTLTYGAALSAGAVVTFPAITGTSIKSITSSPTYVAANEPLSGTFNIQELIIAAVVNGAPTPEPKDVIKPVSVPNVNIIPGHRYKLILEYKVPCLEVITTELSRFSWLNPEEATKSIIMPAADFGFKFDIYYLDNSFKMTINNVRLTVEDRDIQFESGVTNNPVNVSFMNGETHGTNSSQIYNIRNYTPVTDPHAPHLTWQAIIDKPAFRVVIDADGSVSLWGARRVYTNSTGTSLEKLKVISSLTDGITLQQVSWNKEATNNITVSQTITGTTAMFGIGSGLKIIKCP